MAFSNQTDDAAAMTQLNLSARAYHRILKLAGTIAVRSFCRATIFKSPPACPWNRRKRPLKISSSLP